MTVKHTAVKHRNENHRQCPPSIWVYKTEAPVQYYVGPTFGIEISFDRNVSIPVTNYHTEKIEQMREQRREQKKKARANALALFGICFIAVTNSKRKEV